MRVAGRLVLAVFERLSMSADEPAAQWVPSTTVSDSLFVAAFAAFAATNVDDLIIVTALFTAGRATGRPRPRTIIGGQYAGFAGILGISLAVAIWLHAVPDRWVGFFGLVPICLGIWGLWRLRAGDEETPTPPASSVAGIAAITFANGADNIGVFGPLFRSLHVTGAMLCCAVFVALVAVWCVLGALLGTRSIVVTALGQVSHWLVPVVFILIGVLILIGTGALTPLADRL
jgi:cadmium resistance protein CadD (predicted permease)